MWVLKFWSLWRANIYPSHTGQAVRRTPPRARISFSKSSNILNLSRQIQRTLRPANLPYYRWRHNSHQRWEHLAITVGMMPWLWLVLALTPDFSAFQIKNWCANPVGAMYAKSCSHSFTPSLRQEFTSPTCGFTITFSLLLLLGPVRCTYQNLTQVATQCNVLKYNPLYWSSFIRSATPTITRPHHNLPDYIRRKGIKPGVCSLPSALIDTSYWCLVIGSKSPL